MVDLFQKTCTCRKWQLTAIPCPHVISVIYCEIDNGRTRGLPEESVDVCYRRETYLRVYSHLINPVPGPNMWEPTRLNPILSPKHHKQPGRPKKLRRKVVDEHKPPTKNGTEEIGGYDM